MKGLLVLGLLWVSVSAFAGELVFEKNVPAAVKDQMKEDLKFFYDLKLSNQTPLHKKIFGAFNEKTYQTFFETRVLRVGFDQNAEPGVMGYVSPFYLNQMFLTAGYAKASQPQIARLETIYHEARHTERSNGHWPHAVCPTPFNDENGNKVVGIISGRPMAGLEACDVTELGAYALGGILLNNTKYCENCNEKVKMDADVYAQDIVKRITNPVAYQKLKADYKE